MAKGTQRVRTISKNFYDDEVLFKDELGLHLKMGVKRLSYGTELNYNNCSQIIQMSDMFYGSDTGDMDDNE